MQDAKRAERDLPFSFSSQSRLRSKQDFQSVFAKCRKITRKYLLALYIPNSWPYSRLGIIIAKHHVKRAVDRNQIRRVIRESFRQRKEIVKGLDIIVLMRSECATLSKKALRDDVDNLWQQLLIHSSKTV